MFHKSFLVALLTCLSANHTFAQDLSEINWLLGTWISEHPQKEQTSYEIWKAVSDRQFQGVSYTVSGADTSFTESLEIVYELDKFYYVADVPQNPEPVYFRITEMSDTSLTGINPQHDFPQNIEYRRKARGLKVKISGGADARIFRFTKADD